MLRMADAEIDAGLLQQHIAECGRRIKNIRWFIRTDEIYPHVDTAQENIKILSEGIKACEKQIAKKVVIKPHGDIDDDFVLPHCPNCDEVLMDCFDAKDIKYCINCGQKLKWGVMMMRLIDADKINWDKAEDINGNPVYVLDKRDIDKEPTAYDVNKVIYELDRASDYYECDEQGREHVQMVDLTDAIEIVEGGGIDK